MVYDNSIIEPKRRVRSFSDEKSRIDLQLAELFKITNKKTVIVSEALGIALWNSYMSQWDTGVNNDPYKESDPVKHFLVQISVDKTLLDRLETDLHTERLARHRDDATTHLPKGKAANYLH
jgi:hypothetical protein